MGATGISDSRRKGEIALFAAEALRGRRENFCSQTSVPPRLCG
jgi:hypothetical protein